MREVKGLEVGWKREEERGEGARGGVEERRGESYTTYLQGSGSEEDGGTGDGLSLEPQKHVGPQVVVQLVPKTHRSHILKRWHLCPHTHPSVHQPLQHNSTALIHSCGRQACPGPKWRAQGLGQASLTVPGLDQPALTPTLYSLALRLGAWEGWWR